MRTTCYYGGRCNEERVDRNGGRREAYTVIAPCRSPRYGRETGGNTLSGGNERMNRYPDSSSPMSAEEFCRLTGSYAPTSAGSCCYPPSCPIRPVCPPTGATGPTGADGTMPTLTIGTVTTVEPGSPAAASITGTAPNFVLNLSIPRGMTGAAGSAAPTGPTGATGATGPAVPVDTTESTGPREHDDNDH